MTIQEILQEIKKIADNNSFVNFSYIGDVEEMKLQPGFEYPGFAVQNYSYDEETKTYYMSMYLISEDRTLENNCLNVLNDIVFNINLKHLDLGIVIKSDNIQIITAGKLNGAYCSMQLQMTLTSCVCEDKPGYVSSVNGQTGDVILDIPDIERTVIDVNGQTGHVVLDIPEKLSDLYQDIEYATPDFVDEKVTAEHNYTDSVKSNLKDEIGKLVTGVSSVNGSTGDVVIFIPKMTSDLENDSDFIDSEYVDNLIESLNSSVNTNYAKKSELNTAIANEVSRADNKYANKTDIPTDFYTKQEVDDKDKNIIRNTSLNFATKTQLNTAISDEVSRADNKYAKKTDIPTDFYTKQEVDDKVSTKQDVLVSGTNIKTINGKDILGSGDLTIEAGTDEAKVKQIIYSEMSTLYLPEIVNSVENLDNQIIANASINYLLKTDYIAPDVNKEYVDTEIGKLVTGVSSVNGMTGDVIIETADTKYVDDKFDTLNSSVNANFQVKGDYATNERVNNVEAQIPTDVVEHAEIANFVTNSSITENYYKKSEVDNKLETLDSSVSENYVKKGEIPQDVYSKTEVDNLFTEYGETVDSTYEKKGHYDVKISEIDSSISDISTRLAGIKIPTDYVKTADYSADKEAQATKDSEQDSNIATANLNISQVDAKVDNINSSTAEAFGTVTGQISNISGRVETIEDDYVKHNEIAHFVTDSSVADNYARKSSLEGLITEADADNKYYGKTAGEGLYNYVHTELDREITDLHNKDLEIDSSIQDISSRLKTVKDTVNGLDNVYVKSETYNIDKNAQAEVNQDVTTKLGKINNSIGTLNSSVNEIENAGYVTQTWVSGQGYLNAADKTELEDKINGKQDAGDYATNTRVNEVEGKIPDVSGYATKTWVSEQGYLNATDKSDLENYISSKQDAGDYATNTRVNEVEGKIPEVKDFVTNSSISTNYYNKTEIDNKGYLNKVTADGYYQEKGNYVNETVYSNKVSEIDSSISDVYARLKTANDNIANKADQSELANYYTNSKGTALEGRVSSAEQNITSLQEDVQTLDSKITNNYVSNSSISTNYYLKKDVYNKQETEDIVEILRTDMSNTYEQKGHYDSAISTLNSSVNKVETKIQKKQDKLVSGTNIKTINNESILGSGNIEVKGKEHVSLTYAEWEALPYDEQMSDKVYLIKDAENVYQAPLVSGTNIKTINGNSILGEGNIEIQGGGGGTSEHQNITQAEYDALTPEQKQADIVYFITDADVVYATTAYVDEKIGNINTILESI